MENRGQTPISKSPYTCSSVQSIAKRWCLRPRCRELTGQRILRTSGRHSPIAAITASVTCRVVAVPPRSGVCSAASAVTRSIARIGRPGRRPNTRELIISGTPHIVAYRLKGRETQILRVLHGARRWPEQL